MNCNSPDQNSMPHVERLARERATDKLAMRRMAAPVRHSGSGLNTEVDSSLVDCCMDGKPDIGDHRGMDRAAGGSSEAEGVDFRAGVGAEAGQVVETCWNQVCDL